VTLSSLILGLAERMIRLACLRLPEADRDERYREWIAELPAILYDSDVRPAPRRALRALLFAADQHRGIRLPRATVSRFLDIGAGFVATFNLLVAFGGGNEVLLIAILGLLSVVFTSWQFKMSGRWGNKADPR
jgi:hypothetical protein